MGMGSSGMEEDGGHVRFGGGVYEIGQSRIGV